MKYGLAEVGTAIANYFAMQFKNLNQSNIHHGGDQDDEICM
jgi:hypothetical protein